jgi:hypothetical protein
LYATRFECAVVFCVGGVRVKEFLEGLVAAGGHARELGALEGVHGYAADEGDMDAETTVDARARKTHEYAEFGRGLERAFLVLYVVEVWKVLRGMVRREGRWWAVCVPIADSARHSRRTCCCRSVSESPATIAVSISTMPLCFLLNPILLQSIAFQAQHTLLRVSGSTSHILLMMTITART